MKITTIQISGFRKILKATINMEDDITVIAGANNSGKTSIVELFNYVFNAKGALCSDDFPVYESQEWCTAVFPYFQAQFKQENKKDDLIANILGTIVPSENPENEMLLTPIEVLIQVDYDPVGDDIRNFADYIMELDPDNSSFYFIYRFELDKDLLRKSLDSEYEKLCNRFDKLVGDDDKDAEGIRIIKEMLIQIYTDSCKDAAYFSDKTYSNIVPMDVASFRGLFNYQNIMAGRTLDDGNSDRAKILSKNMIDIASQEDNWKTLIQSLPDKIKQSIEDEQIQQEVRKASIETLGKTIGIKGSVLKKGTYIANEEMIKAKLHTVFDRFKDDPYFQFIYGADYESYFSKPGVTKARDCLKGNTAYSILSAYKLFYVGCSRARRNLTILLDSSKIKGNLEPQKKRFEEIGFQVVSSPIH